MFCLFIFNLVLRPRNIMLCYYFLAETSENAIFVKNSDLNEIFGSEKNAKFQIPTQ